ncbi:MAG: polyribonucleotide nucleotidyltransferase [Bdellovibrionales bacterium]|nr:polyribonucleotide nucleotidyltransferase [Bdellovibrionales bacterium]
MNPTEVRAKVGEREVTIQTGKLAKQADGSVVVSCGDNKVLVTICSKKEGTGFDFLPLTVEFQERYYAAGRFPGGFLKREGRPSNDSILGARLVDRPMRPTFPEGYDRDTQIVVTTLSSDNTFPLDILATLGASAAAHISDIPFNGPIASVEVARINGQFVACATPTQLLESDMQITVSGTKDGILMVEGESKFISEADVLSALKFGHQSLQPLLQAQNDLRSKVGKTKREFTKAEIDSSFKNSVIEFVRPKIEAAMRNQEKMARYEGFNQAAKEAKETLLAGLVDDELKQKEKDLKYLIEDIKYRVARDMILNDKVRIDGRNTVTVRPIWTEVGVLPRAHGYGLFTRGETQVLGAVTLGTTDDEQTIDNISGVSKKRFLLHYNFPPYSVGETGRMGGRPRREIGHGNLAERAIKAIIPDAKAFPYAVRVVSEVLESNGSSSMGTVCSGTLALLDAGVPIKENVAGVAMGLIKEGDKIAVLTDILGDEDHLGDMDFKVAGGKSGITALQMDLKIDSVSFEVMEQALKQAHEGRLHILTEMEKTITTARGQISEYAPRIEVLKIHPDKIREVIGPGGKVIKGIVEATGVKINIQDDGTVEIASTDAKARQAAIKMVNDITAEAELGKVYSGKVAKITDFGAFVDILPNTSGLLHISELAHERVRAVTDILKEGDVIDVKVLDIDRSGRIKLSRKALLDPPQQ